MTHNKYQTTNIDVLISTGIENPPSKAIFEKANKKIEKLTEFIFVGSSKASPLCIMIPYFTMSYLLFFTSDLEKKAFRLPFSFW